MADVVVTAKCVFGVVDQWPRELSWPLFLLLGNWVNCEYVIWEEMGLKNSFG
jgi:hypothetical protein